jgi:outer membrane protein assembly factor BamB
MSTRSSLERSVALWMADEAAGGVDDALLHDILAATARARPERRWLALLKEPPMRIRSRVAVGSPTARILLVTLVPLLLLLAGVAATLAVQPGPKTDDWPITLGDYDRTGVADQGPVGRPVVRWQFQAGGSMIHNIAIVGDLVYASSDDGLLHALSRADGSEIWTDPNTGSDVSVTDGLVTVADDTGAIHALDARTGAERWVSVPLSTPTGATYGDGALYIGTGTGELVALDHATGEIRWRTPISNTQVHNPSFRDGRVFVGTLGAYVSLDAADGHVLWTVDLGPDDTGSSRVADGLAFIGKSGDALSSHIRAIDAESGRELWNAEGLFGAPTLGDGLGYSGGQGRLTAFDLRTGAQRWYATFDGGLGGPVLANGVLYVLLDLQPMSYALDAATGGELWRFDVDGGVTAMSLAGGTLFEATDTGRLYAIGGDGTSITPGPIPSVAPLSPVPSQAPVASPATPSQLASFVWSATAPDPGFVSAAIARAPDGTLWVADVDGDRFALFSPEGEFLDYWAPDGATKLRLRKSNGDPFGGIAFAPDGAFYILNVGDRTVLHFDFQRNLVGDWGGFGDAPGQYQDPVWIRVGPDGTVSVGDDVRGVIESYDADGNLRSSRPVSNQSGGLAFDADGNLYLGLPTGVQRIDATGQVTGAFGAPGSGDGALIGGPTGAAITPEGRLVVTQLRFADAPGAMVYAPDGTFLGSWGPRGRGEGDLGFPWGIVLDDQGNAYISEYGGDPQIPSESRLQKFHLELPR